MTHPTREEWMEYLYGEADAKPRTQLAAHLQSCPECRQRIAEWRQAMNDLDQWSLPQGRRSIARAGRAFRWAAAAMLLLALGLGLGLGSARLLAPRRSDGETLRKTIEDSLGTALEARLRERLREELRADLKASLTTACEHLQTDLSQQFRREIGRLATDTVAASGIVTRGLLAEFVRSYYAARADETQAILKLLTQIESERITEQELLRNDVETLASYTGEEFLRTKQDMVRLFAHARTSQPKSNGPGQEEDTLE